MLTDPIDIGVFYNTAIFEFGQFQESFRLLSTTFAAFLHYKAAINSFAHTRRGPRTRVGRGRRSTPGRK